MSLTRYQIILCNAWQLTSEINSEKPASSSRKSLSIISIYNFKAERKHISAGSGHIAVHKFAFLVFALTLSPPEVIDMRSLVGDAIDLGTAPAWFHRETTFDKYINVSRRGGGIDILM